MVVMTAKVNKKRAILVLGALVALIVLICVLSGRKDSGSAAPQESPITVATNDARVQYLEDFGWQVAASPVETQQVLVPTELTEVYQRYNALQMSQGFDLTQYAGKTATRYVYRIENYPNATEPVYATLLVYENHVIGADITDTAANGVVQGLEMPQ